MLVELRVAQLGVIEDLTVVLGPGMTVLTGETGAGKTLIVEAVALLLGGRADGIVVRPGAARGARRGALRGSDAGRRDRPDPDSPGVGAQPGLRRWPHGRGGRPAQTGRKPRRPARPARPPVAPAPHRPARRPSTPADPSPPMNWPGRPAGCVICSPPRARSVAMPGPGPANWTSSATSWRSSTPPQLVGPTEDQDLREEEERLSNTAALRLAAESVGQGLASDGGIVDQLGVLVATVSGPAVLAPLRQRLLALQAELSDLAHDAGDRRRWVRGRSRAAGGGGGSPEDPHRSAPQVRRHPGRGHGLPCDHP